jgi:AraC-like DNA-binding protein
MTSGGREDEVLDQTRELLQRPIAPDTGAWQQRVGAFSRLPDLLRGLGADPAVLLEAAGLDAHALDRPDAAIPYASMGRLLSLSAERTGCEHVGVLAGRLWRLSDLGAVGEMVARSSTVAEALRMLSAHQSLNSGGGLAFLIERPPAIDLGYAIYHPGVVGIEYLFDAAIGVGMQMMRELCGPAFVPLDVLLPHRKPADVTPWRALFRVTPRFDAEIAALRFAPSWLERPLASADPRRLQAVLRTVERPRRDDDLVPRAMRVLRLLMLNGRVSGEETASMLLMHRRTLNRRLKAQGTTFQAVLDRVRFEAARQLLEKTRLPLDDVAASLGYASVSPFMRSFRRWTGTTPGHWRRGGADRREAA